jgi:hypothetical protein
VIIHRYQLGSISVDEKVPTCESEIRQSTPTLPSHPTDVMESNEIDRNNEFGTGAHILTAWRSHSSIQTDKHRESKFEHAEVRWREARLGKLCGAVSSNAKTSKTDWGSMIHEEEC